MRFLRTIHQRGSLTLPSDIRDVMEIQEGDVVEFEVLRIVRRPSKGSQAPPATPTKTEATTA